MRTDMCLKWNIYEYGNVYEENGIYIYKYTNVNGYICVISGTLYMNIYEKGNSAHSYLHVPHSQYMWKPSICVLLVRC